MYAYGNMFVCIRDKSSRSSSFYDVLRLLNRVHKAVPMYCCCLKNYSLCSDYKVDLTSVCGLFSLAYIYEYLIYSCLR